MSESANFVMPHWLYWVWLIVMPPLFMLLTRRRGGVGGERLRKRVWRRATA